MKFETLSPALQKMLDLLDNTPRRPNNLGTCIWGEGGYRGSACSAPYARPAGRLLNRLDKLGLAYRVHRGDDWGWVVTFKGRGHQSETR